MEEEIKVINKKLDIIINALSEIGFEAIKYFNNGNQNAAKKSYDYKKKIFEK